MTSITSKLDSGWLPVLEGTSQGWSQVLRSRWLPLLPLVLAAVTAAGLLSQGPVLPLLLGLALATCLLMALGLASCLRLLRRQQIQLQQQQDQLRDELAQVRGLEKELETLRQREAVKSNLLCVLAHDLRSPFASLKNMVWLLEQHLLEPEETQTLLPSMRRQLDGLYGSLDNLLLWSNQQAFQEGAPAAPVPVTALVREAMGLHQASAQQKQLTLSVQGPASGWAVVDSDALRLILRNLLDNAVKFTPSGGHIEVSVQTSAQDVKLQIQDSGLGMSPEQLERLFSGNGPQVRRGTSGEKGLGLGLQLCRRYAEACGGELRVSSQLGTGTCFEIRLPVREIAVEAEAKIGSRAPGQSPG